MTALALPHLIEAGRVSANPSEEELAWVTKVVSLFHEQMSYGAEIVSLSSLKFTTIDEESQQVLSKSKCLLSGGGSREASECRRL